MKNFYFKNFLITNILKFIFVNKNNPFHHDLYNGNVCILCIFKLTPKLLQVNKHKIYIFKP